MQFFLLVCLKIFASFFELQNIIFYKLHYLRNFIENYGRWVNSNENYKNIPKPELINNPNLTTHFYIAVSVQLNLF